MPKRIQSLLEFILSEDEAESAAARLIADYFSPHRLLAAPHVEIDRLDYLPEKARSLIKLTSELCREFSRSPLLGRPVVPSDPELGEYLRSVCGHSPVECARVIFLDAESRMLADEEVGRGEPFSVSVSARAIIKRALQLEASSIILVHSHPSGELVPGHMDLETTRNIRIVAHGVDITVMDHLIVTRHGHLSLRDAGYMN